MRVSLGFHVRFLQGLCNLSFGLFRGLFRVCYSKGFFRVLGFFRMSLLSTYVLFMVS